MLKKGELTATLIPETSRNESGNKDESSGKAEGTRHPGYERQGQFGIKIADVNFYP